MQRAAVIALLVVGVLFRVVYADEPPAPTTPTIVSGRVTDVFGKPVPNMRVYVLPHSGNAYRTTTNKDGRYSVQVSTPGTYGVVIAVGKAHTFRTVMVKEGVTNTLDVDVELDTSGGEVIKIDDQKRPQPAVKAKPKQDERLSLPYSEEAVERDAWARAWLLLDVDEAGQVTRLKLLKKPGFNLEKICLEEAFKLRFDPARDAAGQRMKTYVLWSMEWPSWGWLVQGNGTVMRRPKDSDQVNMVSRGGPQAGGVEQIGGTWSTPPAQGTAFERPLSRVPCYGSQPLDLDLQNRTFRDCSRPNMSAAVSLPWITRETAPTAVAEMSAPKQRSVREDKPRGSRVPGYIGFGVAGAFGAAAVASFIQYDRYHSKVVRHAQILTFDRAAIKRDEDKRDRWRNIAMGMSAVMLVAGGATLFLWNREEPNFSVQPSNSGYGGSAVYTTAW